MSPHDVLRPAALCAVVLLTACQREATTAPAPGVGNAAIAPRVAAAAPPANDALLQRFLTEHSEDVEACFADMPAPDTGAATVDLRAAGGGGARPNVDVVVAIDASGSMAVRASGTTRMEVAKRAASEFLASLPEGTQVGLLAFGHRGSNRAADKPASCAAAEPIYPVGQFDRAAVAGALKGFDARGWTPLAAAIEAAGRMLPANASGAPQAIYIVSDGEDTCGGDAVAAARTVHADGAQAIVNIIGFDLPAADRAQLQEVARAGGGVFTELQGDRATDLLAELQRSNHNFIQGLWASNANSGTQLRNSNRTFSAGLRLGNCVAGRALREGNAVRRWASGQNLSPAETDALQARLAALHTEQRARAARIVDAATRATDDANERIEGVQKANEAQVESVR